MKYFFSLLLIAYNSSVYAVPDNIYLFRHSEKSQGENPHLSAEGQQRAEKLSLLIEGNQQLTLYSTDYNRTLETADALAKHFDIAAHIYNPKDLAAVKERLLNQTGTVIVIGHSNTSVQLAALISELPVKEMPESEFSRYFLLEYTGKNYHLSDLTMNF